MKLLWRCRRFGHKLTPCMVLAVDGDEVDGGEAVLLPLSILDGSEDGYTCRRRRCSYFVRALWARPRS